MTPSQLRAFHLVALESGFTGAARASGTSQPTLSAQVKALEASYGVRLFERQGRGVRATELGQALYAVTARLFAAEDEARALLGGAKSLTRGHLRIAADSASHVMPVLAEVRRRHGGITFSLRIGNSAEVLRDLLGYEADIAVMARMTSDPRLFATELKRDRLILFVPVSHPWSRRRRVKLADTADQDIVLRERGSITREVFEQTLAAAGIRPRSLFEVQTREAVREAVAAGFGIGVVFEGELGEDPRFHPVVVIDAALAVAEYAVCLQERRRLALVRAFFDAIEAPGGVSHKNVTPP
jgi:aminoethylphosphonate catabolism LysR family transcriptional regulator